MQNRDQLSIRGKINNRFILFLAIIFSDIVKSSKNDRLTTQFHYVRLKQHNTTYVKRSPLSAKMRGFNDKSHFHSHGKSWRSVDRGRHSAPDSEVSIISNSTSHSQTSGSYSLNWTCFRCEIQENESNFLLEHLNHENDGRWLFLKYSTTTTRNVPLCNQDSLT